MKSQKEGHRERLRTRYLQAGAEGFPDYDMLELLLTYAVPRRDVKPIARALIQQFHDLPGVMNASMENLCKVEGIGKNSALLIFLLRDLCVRFLEAKAAGVDVLCSTTALNQYARMRLATYTEEVLLLIYLNVRNQIIRSRVVARGIIDTLVLHPKMIAEEALQNKASSLIMVHNHPSGITDPSPSDVAFTRKVQKVLDPLEIPLLDHLIVSRISSYSFRDHNMLAGKL